MKINKRNVQIYHKLFIQYALKPATVIAAQDVLQEIYIHFAAKPHYILLLPPEEQQKWNILLLQKSQIKYPLEINTVTQILAISKNFNTTLNTKIYNMLPYHIRKTIVLSYSNLIDSEHILQSSTKGYTDFKHFYRIHKQKAFQMIQNNIFPLPLFFIKKYKKNKYVRKIVNEWNLPFHNIIKLLHNDIWERIKIYLQVHDIYNAQIYWMLKRKYYNPQYNIITKVSEDFFKIFVNKIYRIYNTKIKKYPYLTPPLLFDEPQNPITFKQLKHIKSAKKIRQILQTRLITQKKQIRYIIKHFPDINLTEYSSVINLLPNTYLLQHTKPEHMMAIKEIVKRKIPINKWKHLITKHNKFIILYSSGKYNRTILPELINYYDKHIIIQTLIDQL